MPVTTDLLLVLAGIGSGLAGSVAGLASLVSYPALLATGLGPIAANVTNTLALIWTSVGAAWGYRPELAEEGPRLKVLVPAAALGGIVGGVLLLVTPSDAFAKVVPWLIAAGSLAVVLRRRPGSEAVDPAHRSRRSTPLVVAGVFAVAIYGGYFGAAAGVVLLGLFTLTTWEPLARCRALTSVLLGVANLVAAVAFSFDGPVHWGDVVPLAVGCLIGGRLGPPIVRRAPVGPLRVGIALAGLGLAVHLGLDAYR